MKTNSTLRSRVIRLIQQKQPFLGDCISGLRMYRHTKICHSRDQNIFAKAFFVNGLPHVISGPFSGMCYENRTYFGPVTPRWIGSYEKELHPIVDQIKNLSPDCIVDIGAAEGYYSIGLALMFPKVNVFSYETNPLSLWQQSRLRRLNKASNLTIRRYCSQKQLCKHGSNRCFILSDIEGCEADLFSAEVVSHLSTSFVLIELHSYGSLDVNSVETLLRKRFEVSHHISYITPTQRTLKDVNISYPTTFDAEMVVFAMQEFRSQPQRWMYCTPIE